MASPIPIVGESKITAKREFWPVPLLHCVIQNRQDLDMCRFVRVEAVINQFGNIILVFTFLRAVGAFPWSFS
jgi:hypothetical protein